MVHFCIVLWNLARSCLDPFKAARPSDGSIDRWMVRHLTSSHARYCTVSYFFDSNKAGKKVTVCKSCWLHWDCVEDHTHAAACPVYESSDRESCSVRGNRPLFRRRLHPLHTSACSGSAFVHAYQQFACSSYCNMFFTCWYSISSVDPCSHSGRLLKKWPARRPARTCSCLQSSGAGVNA